MSNPSLYPFQKAGVEWLLRHPRGGLFDDQGLGKTCQAIVAFERLGLRRVLVVAPTVVTHNWKREVQTWAPSRVVQVVKTGRDKLSPVADVVVVSHSLLLRSAIVEQLRGFDLVVLDEAHHFRTPSAKRTKAFFLGAEAIARRSPRCWLLTGTPLPNNPSEIWTFLAGIAPHRLRDEGAGGRLLNYYQFRDRYCVCRTAMFGRQKVVQIVGARDPEGFRSRIADFGLRRMKSQELQLPPIRYGTVSVTPDVAIKLPGVTEAEAAKMTPEELVAAMQRSPHFSEWRHLCGRAKAQPAVDLLREDLESGMQKVVVFAHHLDVLETLRAGLAEFKPVMLTGSVSPVGRQAAVDAFQTDSSVRVCLAQINAGGVGVTLTAASDAVFVEQSFVPGDNAQAADRIYRIGQTRPVLIRMLALAGSVDEVVATVLARKTEMLRQVLR